MTPDMKEMGQLHTIHSSSKASNGPDDIERNQYDMLNSGTNGGTQAHLSKLAEYQVNHEIAQKAKNKSTIAIRNTGNL